MRAIVSAKLGEYVGNVALDRRFPDGELIGNQFVGVSGGNQPQYIKFARRQLVIGRMLSQLRRDVRRNSLLSGMDSTDSLQQFSMHMPLQYVTPGTRFKGPQHLSVACISRKNNDARMGIHSECRRSLRFH